MVIGTSVYGQGTHPWVSIPCHFSSLPSCLPPFSGRDGAAPLEPFPGNVLGEGGKLGARWEGGASLSAQEADILLLPRVYSSYFLINWECCSFAGDFQMFPLSSIVAMRAHTTWVWELLPAAGWGTGPCHEGKGSP